MDGFIKCVRAIGLSVALGGSLTACVSMSTLQTARTLEKGKAEWAVGGGTYNSGAIVNAVIDADEPGTIKADDLSVPNVEVQYRQGLTDKWDMGLKIAGFGSYTADGKYSLINGEKFAMATGLGLTYFNVKVEAGGTESDTTVIDAIVPLYVSYDIQKNFAIYGGPKYVFRSISGDGDSGNASLLAGSVGTKIGTDWGAYIEGTYFTSLAEEFDGTQFNLSFFWNAGSIF